MAATALDADSSDTMLLCTHGGVLVEMHLDQDAPSAIGRSWDLGTLVGPGQCEGLAWVQDANSQVGVDRFKFLMLNRPATCTRAMILVLCTPWSSPESLSRCVTLLNCLRETSTGSSWSPTRPHVHAAV